MAWLKFTFIHELVLWQLPQLVGNPALLLLDEPLEGLAPIIVDALLVALHRLREDEGLAMVLVEQHARLALEFAPEVAVLNRGRVVYRGPSQTLLNDAHRLTELVGVADQSIGA